MPISKYLKENSIVREELLNLKLFYELKKAASEREYHLKIFQATVDFEGFDIIIDDNLLTGKYQIKTKWKSKVPKWDIHRNMLFPSTKDAKTMRLGDSLMCSNVEKGVILLDVKSIDNEFLLDYYFTNFYIIKGISHQLIKKSKSTTEVAKKTIIELLGKKGRQNDKIKINKGLFVKLKNPMCLLAICGFDNSINVHPQMRFLQLFENNKIAIKEIEENLGLKSVREILDEELNQILDEPPKGKISNGISSNPSVRSRL